MRVGIATELYYPIYPKLQRGSIDIRQVSDQQAKNVHYFTSDYISILLAFERHKALFRSYYAYNEHDSA